MFIRIVAIFLTRKYVSAPLTSIISEQLVATTDLMYSDQHNILLEDAAKLLFNSYSIKLFKYNY